MDIQLNRIAGAQNERAGILQSPGNVGDVEIAVHCEIRTRDVNGNRN